MGLLRGPAAERVARRLSPDDDPPRWSGAAGGWVVSERVAVDALGYAQVRGLIVHVTETGAAS
jgi:hypothetical protein